MENKTKTQKEIEQEMLELNEQFSSFLHTKGIAAKFKLAFNNMSESAKKQHAADVAEFAAVKASGVSADSAEAQALATKLQTHITENYYTCTDEILAGLGKMYVADERFKSNIDKYGEGTAEFAAEAIAVYCRKA